MSHRQAALTSAAVVDLTAYRITKEALTNVVKHAPQAKARVDIRHKDAGLIVEVTNSLSAGRQGVVGGIGEGHNGLLNMRERATLVGGTSAAGPNGSDWLVRAVPPVSGGDS